MSNPAIHDPWYARQAETPLDPSILSLADDEANFFKSQTGISTDEELREHVVAVQRKAFTVWPYPCIRRFAFTKLKISRFPVYNELLKLGRERRGAILLDLGCCFGNDARKAVADGFPASQVIASDLRPEFWSLGHELFRDTPDSCSIRFVQGDVFSDTFINPHTAPSSISADPIAACVDSASLVPLQGRAAAIHTSAFFHLFNESQQLEVAKRCVALLSAEPGSIIFGSHSGAAVAGARPDRDTFAHSPESWKRMWSEEVFPHGGVAVEAELMSREMMRVEGGSSIETAVKDGRAYEGGWLVWVVRRI
ncbi:hypothetical protein EXIGLDRAFT_610045 [Exidia glandulosa HHB12029]|uniref:Methyltransferase domain-containing protein n=1 Tax=Exidia glandulosa HHB12029 TaxID=1314781 RepID=A0A165K4W2_EXIGL|nr:hypothetical protein EXIGLDRAFT_610045 [Exidia glandulosa HHB12029]